MGVFHVFLDCTNGTKSRNVPQIKYKNKDTRTMSIDIIIMSLMLVLSIFFPWTQNLLWCIFVYFDDIFFQNDFFSPFKKEKHRKLLRLQMV